MFGSFLVAQLKTKWQTEFLPDLIDQGLATFFRFVNIHRNDLDTELLKFVGVMFPFGQLFQTRLTPRCPKVDESRFLLVR